LFNQFGDLERSALRLGNVHSADGWDGVLKPVVTRYQGKVSRIYFRADAAFTMPEVYEFLKAERIKYAIRLPANQVLQSRIGYLLKRPVGRPPNEVRRFHAKFSYRAGSWTKPRRVIAKVEWHPGELYPRVGFIVTNLSRPVDRVVAFYNKRGTCEQWIKEGKGAINWTLAILPDVRCQCGSPSTSCAVLQSRQFHAHAGDARTDQGLVADEFEGQADQDRRKGGEPWTLRCLSDGSIRTLLPSVALERMTIERLTLVPVVAAAVVPAMSRKISWNTCRGADLLIFTGPRATGTVVSRQPSAPCVYLAGRPEKHQYSRRFGSHLGNPGLSPKTTWNDNLRHWPMSCGCD
jgi:hypothetical protein